MARKRSKRSKHSIESIQKTAIAKLKLEAESSQKKTSDMAADIKNLRFLLACILQEAGGEITIPDKISNELLAQKNERYEFVSTRNIDDNCYLIELKIKDNFEVYLEKASEAGKLARS